MSKITVMTSVTIDFDTWFYKNCKRQRKNGAKICGECPFREAIEHAENERDRD